MPSHTRAADEQNKNLEKMRRNAMRKREEKNGLSRKIHECFACYMTLIRQNDNHAQRSAHTGEKKTQPVYKYVINVVVLFAENKVKIK